MISPRYGLFFDIESISRITLPVNLNHAVSIGCPGPVSGQGFCSQGILLLHMFSILFNGKAYVRAVVGL